MIVRLITVAGWRCFLEETTIGPFDDGLNVIHAPNGTGKSSLFEAMRRALLDGHKVSGREVESIRPWGRLLAPRVTVELAHGGDEYRITKQYLDSPVALLERKENGRFRKLAEGAGADEHIRRLISKNPPARGLARLENWGAAQVLWAPQGSLAIGALSGDLAADIRDMLGAQVSSTSTSPIEQRIQDRYLQLFTAKGKLKAGKEAPLLVHLKEQLAVARQALQAAREQHQAFDDASRRVEELRARRDQTRRDTDEIARALRAAQIDADAYRDLQNERTQRARAAEAAEAQYRALKQHIEHTKSVQNDLAESQQARKELEEQVSLRLRELQEFEKEAAQRKADLEDARSGRGAVDAAIDVAEAARRFTECLKDLNALNELIANVQNAEAQVEQARQRRQAHLAPDAPTLRAVRKAIQERDEARLRIDASLITLEIVPKADVSLDIISGESLGTMCAQPGVPARVKGSPEVVVDMGGIARLRAWGPSGSIEEHRAARARAEQRLKELTLPFGCSDLDALESLAATAKELDARLREAEAARQALLAQDSLENLIARRNARQAEYRAFLESHPDWETAPPDAGALGLQALTLKNAFVARIESCETARDKAQNALACATGQQNTLLARLEDVRKRSESLISKLADLTRDGISLSVREAELRQLLMTWEAAKAHLTEIDGQLGRFAEDPAPVVARIVAQLDSLNQNASRARDEEVRQETKLESLGAQGPYSALVAAEERVTQLEERVRREELHVEAIRLLHDTLTACRTEAVAAVAMPVEAAATRILQRIAGRRLGSIKIGEAFAPERVLPELVDQPVALENLSGGEQEQLYLAARLALAEVLARNERQLVVLDDVLTATDAGRLARIMGVLEDAAERLQILILSCHPERYRGLTQARFFDLEELSRP